MTARIDKQAALDLMRSGESDSQIASRFGTSRQAVNLLRKSLTKAGKLDTHRVETPFGSPTAAVGPKPDDLPPLPKRSPSPRSAAYPTLDQISDWVINLVSMAADARMLQRQNADLTATQASLQAQILRLQQQLKEAQELLFAAAAKSSKYENAINGLPAPLPPQQPKH